jgi:hypothetical protein
MSETRKLTAILVFDIVGFSRLARADEERILARLRTLRSDLIDPTIAVHRGRIVKRTGDGGVVEFQSVVDAVRARAGEVIDARSRVDPDHGIGRATSTRLLVGRELPRAARRRSRVVGRGGRSWIVGLRGRRGRWAGAGAAGCCQGNSEPCCVGAGAGAGATAAPCGIVSSDMRRRMLALVLCIPRGRSRRRKRVDNRRCRDIIQMSKCLEKL